MSLWSRLTEKAGQPRTAARETDALAPEKPFLVIGDVHGRLDLLKPMLDLARRGEPVVTLGDYIDRGPDSAGVLSLLHALNLSGRVSCLLGNHEQLLLDFLDRPEEAGELWLTNGGMQTLWSFGLELGSGDTMAALRRAAAELSGRLGPIEPWLRQLPLMWRSGNVVVVHAATDPVQPLNRQDPQVLLWGRPAPDAPARADGIWVVHGHTIVAEPLLANHRFNIDTGAFRTGRLTGLRISRGGYELLP